MRLQSVNEHWTSKSLETSQVYSGGRMGLAGSKFHQSAVIARKVLNDYEMVDRHIAWVTE